MKNTQRCVRRSLRSRLTGLAFCLAVLAPAAGALGDSGANESDSLIDTIIDWIDDLFGPAEPEDEIPSEGDGW